MGVLEDGPRQNGLLVPALTAQDPPSAHFPPGRSSACPADKAGRPSLLGYALAARRIVFKHLLHLGLGVRVGFHALIHYI